LRDVVTTSTDPNGIQPANCPTNASDPNCSTQPGVELVLLGRRRRFSIRIDPAA
jgi:hypothetical protein